MDLLYVNKSSLCKNRKIAVKGNRKIIILIEISKHMIYCLIGLIDFLHSLAELVRPAVGLGFDHWTWTWSMSIGLDMTHCLKPILCQAATFWLYHLLNLMKIE